MKKRSTRKDGMMIYIGIDVAKYKHDFCVINKDGEVLIPSTTITNNREGFNLFLKLIEPYLKKGIKIGFESTGHYSVNLKNFLRINTLPFMEMNALLVAMNKRNRTLRKTKTDKADAYAIALTLLDVPFKCQNNKLEKTHNLKLLCRYRRDLVESRSKEYITLGTVYDQLFPEFKPLFNNEFTVTALYLIDKYRTPQKIANLNSKSFEVVRSLSRGHMTSVKFYKIIDAAKNTVGIINDVLEARLDFILKSLNRLNIEIQNIEKQIIIEMESIPTNIHTITGIGIIGAATILGEFGDINRFSSPNKMLAFAGIDPSKNQSGTIDVRGKMVKRGSSVLRHQIMISCVFSLTHNAEFYSYYTKKRNEGKAHWVAISHLAKKLIRIIFKLETDNIPYSATW